MPNVFPITVRILPARRLDASCWGGEGGHYSSGRSVNPKGRSRPPSSCLAAGAEVEATENKYINKHTPTSLLFFLAAAQKTKEDRDRQVKRGELLVKDDGKSSPTWE